MARMNRHAAHDILQRCKVPKGSGYHELSSSQVEALIAEADAYGYQKPKNANGSRGRYFHAFVERVASRESE